MAQKVFKYPIGGDLGHTFRIDMPQGASILSVVSKRDGRFIYALVDEEAPVEKRLFIVVGTGWEFTDFVISFIGTITEDNYYVWHVFEVEDA